MFKNPIKAVTTVAAAVIISVALGSNALFAQDDIAVVVSSPVAWTTLRSDSVVVSIQADVSKLPKNTIDFKVFKRTGSRSSTLFTKSVKPDNAGAEAFLGRVNEKAVGGIDFLSIAWSVPGTEFKGVIEPIGFLKLDGTVSADNKWIPARPALLATKLKDDLSDDQAALALIGIGESFEVGSAKFTAGWNMEGLYILIMLTPDMGGNAQVEFAFDPKCGKNAFLSRADKFVSYAVGSDSVTGSHHGNRFVNKEAGVTFEGQKWGDKSSLSLLSVPAVKNDMYGQKIIKIKWYELGLEPFDERNLGFYLSVTGKGNKQTLYPTSAVRAIPGTWGDIKLAK